MDDLESLLDSISVVPPKPTVVNLPGITKIRYTHDAMIDAIIATPSISQNELGRVFGYSASWVSQILSSDTFKMRLSERREELVDPAIRANVENQFEALVRRSQEHLLEKLNGPASTIPDNLAIRTLEVASRALGYGANKEKIAAQVNVDVHLETLGENLVNLLRRKKVEVIENDPLINTIAP